MLTLRPRQRTIAAAFGVAAALAGTGVAAADTAPQGLPFSQDWGNTSLITTNDDWSGVPGVIGYRGDELTSATATDPRTITAESTVVDVNANQTNPNTFNTGGVTEFELTNPTVALTGSGTADAPYLQVSLNTTDTSDTTFAYVLRDLESGPDNAQQQVATQFRVGTSGAFTDLGVDGYTADATSGPNVAGPDMAQSVVLPDATDDQPVVQVRVITTNAVGNDEHVGIDNLTADGTPIGDPVDPNACDFQGGPEDDTFVGTADDEVICGGGGDDFLRGGGGNDTLRGEDGNDTLLGDEGNDSSDGAAGDDVLGDGAGDDTYRGGGGTDRVTYATTTTPVTADLGAQDGTEDGLGFSAGNGPEGQSDRIFADVEDLRGGTAGDDLVGSSVANLITGEGGDDSIDGGQGNDRLRGVGGADTVLGGSGNDTVEGQEGNDQLDGEDGNDLIIGSTGDDELDGGAGLDTLQGLAGADFLRGDEPDGIPARDSLDCGTQVDRFTRESIDTVRACETPVPASDND